MKIHFHGAARTVTGSQHLLEINGYKILLDCGLYQGKRAESYQRNLHLPFDAASCDLLILSHAHIDHSGNIPNLVKSGFKGDIFCTYATRDLCTILLEDSAKIQEQDLLYLNKKLLKKNEPPLEPIYTVEDVVEALKYFIAIGYGRRKEVLPGIFLTFRDAGHILGSAIVTLEFFDQDKNRQVTFVFSGDLGRPDMPILCDPTLIPKADILLIESTYGDREHGQVEEIKEELAQIISRTVTRGGKIIIPAFAVGRTQELIYRLHQLYNEKKIPQDLPIFADSPLAVNATNIYRLHPEAFDKETYEFMLNDNRNDPFGFERLRYVRTTSQSKELNDIKGPAIIMSASGMAEAGRILHHLKNNIGDERNTICIVGWQAPYTLGRRIAEKQPKVKIFGEEYELKAEVDILNGFSAHAGRSFLLQWANAVTPHPANTFVIHGEEKASLSLAAALREQGFNNVEVPQPEEMAEL